MTIVVAVDDLPLEQVTKQLNKLVNVIKIVELEPAASVQRELLLVKVRADAGGAQPGAGDRATCSGPRRSTSRPEALTIEATGTVEKIAALLRNLEPYGIREMVQSGTIAVGRGPRSITAQSASLDQRPSRSPERNLATRHEREHLLRRRRRPVDHPGPQGRGDRLRQPGPRALAVAARLRRRRPDRPARGLEVAGQGRRRGAAGGDPGRGRRRGRPDHDPGPGHQAALHLRRRHRAEPRSRRRASSSGTASTSATT